MTVKRALQFLSFSRLDARTNCRLIQLKIAPDAVENQKSEKEIYEFADPVPPVAVVVVVAPPPPVLVLCVAPAPVVVLPPSSKCAIPKCSGDGR